MNCSMGQTAKECIAAGIVLYQPNIARLRENLDAICGQVSRVYLVDNASDNLEQVQTLLAEYTNCILIKKESNTGIAAALNTLMEAAGSDGYLWTLTLDDDSVCDENLVSRLAMYTDREKTGIVCAEACDDKIGSPSGNLAAKGEVREVEHCITAGSLTNFSVWRQVGGFDEKMFIDFVDVEYCTRLKRAGFQILQANGVFVHQEYGSISGSFSIFGKKFYLYNYSPVRVYYSVRNQIYYMRKHRGYISLRRWQLFLLGYIGKRLFFEQDRWESMKAVVRGVKDGKKM